MRTTDANETCAKSAVVHRVCPSFAVGHRKRADFLAAFAPYGGLKNRRLAQCKMWIGEVLISRTLSVCGEVAERLKAAVC